MHYITKHSTVIFSLFDSSDLTLQMSPITHHRAYIFNLLTIYMNFKNEFREKKFFSFEFTFQ